MMSNIFKALGSLLLVISAVAAAIAAGLSYRTSERSFDLATQAQTFVERVRSQQVLDEAPFISVLSGRTFIDRFDPPQFGSDPIPHYAADFYVHNSGGRDAGPLWIGFVDAHSTTSKPWVREVDTVPKQAAVNVSFDLGSNSDVKPTEWIVGMMWSDGASGHTDSRKHCTEARFVRVEGRQFEGATKPALTVISSGSPHVLGSLASPDSVLQTNPSQEADRRLLAALQSASSAACEQ